MPDAIPPQPTPLAGHVTFVGAGPGDPDLLTLRALRAITAADVVIHDRLIGAGILALIDANRRIDVGKQGFGPSTLQADINAALVAHAVAGARVVRLKAGDCGIFGRLDEEIEALEAAGLPHSIVPGLTAATVAAAHIGQSLTQRGRNSALRILTGHDTAGFADQDWRSLARPGEVAAIYMAKAAARYLQGRLLMHGALPDTPVTLVENVSCPAERVIAATLATLATAVTGLAGPAVILYGLAPRQAVLALQSQREARA